MHYISTLFSIIMLACALNTHAQNTMESVAKPDSVIKVIGWFCSNDTLEYNIVNAQYRVGLNDTIKTAEMTTKVRVVVTDSTSTGYKMNYTILDVEGNPEFDNMQQKLIEKLGRKFIGTRIDFETDEFGKITKINDKGKLKKMAKIFMKTIFDEICAVPGMELLKAHDIDFRKLEKAFDINVIAENMIKELQMLFRYHGNYYKIGEFREHEDATETNYEFELYQVDSLDSETGCYSIEVEILNYVPCEDMYEDTKNLFRTLKSDIVNEAMEKTVYENIKDNFLKQEIFEINYLPEGWPYRIHNQESTTQGPYGKISITFIYLTSMN